MAGIIISQLDRYIATSFKVKVNKNDQWGGGFKYTIPTYVVSAEK